MKKILRIGFIALLIILISVTGFVGLIFALPHISLWKTNLFLKKQDMESIEVCTIYSYDIRASNDKKIYTYIAEFKDKTISLGRTWAPSPFTEGDGLYYRITLNKNAEAIRMDRVKRNEAETFLKENPSGCRKNNLRKPLVS